MKRKPHGLTLVELLVAMAVAGILLAVAVPQVSGTLQARAVGAQSEALAGDLRLARSEALRRGTPVVVCARAAGGGDPACASSTDWKQGWVIYADPDRNDTLNGGELIRANEALTSVQKAEAKVKSWTDSSQPSIVRFQPTGIPNGEFTYSLVPTSGDAGSARCVTLLRSGNVKTAAGVCP